MKTFIRDGGRVNIWIPSVSSKGPEFGLLGTYLFIFLVNHEIREREVKKGVRKITLIWLKWL